MGILLLMMPAGVLLAKKKALPQRADVRVLIDISGSMKKNDPQNLRRSALRLLVGLMPVGGRAGVWTFGQYVNTPVPLGYVNEVWKEHARDRAERIHSRGLFTDIEQALLQATKGWTDAPTRFRRELVLLTDGMVDVSKDAAESAASRERILSRILPRLKKRGVRIHTIALSERADHALMQQLSHATNGWCEQVNSAGELQRVFLRIFEKVSRPDTVPIGKDNRFRIDGSVREATLLIFKNRENPRPTRLVSPAGKVFDIRNIPKSIAWHQDEGYDLLTITRPTPGEWRIQADLDPDNRVMVVTDLRMHTTDIASQVAVGERLPFIVQFSDHGKKITRSGFLKMVTVTSEYRIGPRYSEPQPIRDDGKGGDKMALDGTFSAIVARGVKAGGSELVVTAQGKTFMRERRQAFEARLPVKLHVEPREQAGKKTVEVILQPDEQLIRGASLSPAAWSETADGKRAGIILTPDGTGRWQGWVDESTLTEPQQLHVRIRAISQRGNRVELEMDPVAIEALRPPASAPPVATPPAPAGDTPAPAAQKKSPAPETTEAESDGWMWSAALFAGGNLLLLLLGGAGYWFYKKRRGDELVQLLDDEDEEEAQ